jgi:hypothetical protein
MTDLGDGIHVIGDKDFTATVQQRLTTIRANKTGAQVLADMDASGRQVLITPNTNSEGTYLNDATTRPVNAFASKSDSIISLDPNMTEPNRLDPEKPAPNDSVLAHELIHATHFANGTSAMDQPLPGTGWRNQEEKNTIQDGTPSENQYLADSGYGYHRIDHAFNFAPNDPGKQP